jgi:hypothetical protein
MHQPSGEIGMIPIVDSFDGEVWDYHPISAVAVTLTGFRASRFRDIWQASDRIGLSKGNSVLIFTAALIGEGLNSQLQEVRAELIDHLVLDSTAKVHIGRFLDQATGVMSDDLQERHRLSCEPPMMRWTRFMKASEPE